MSRRVPFSHNRRDAGYMGLLTAVVELAWRDALLVGPQMAEMEEEERLALQECAIEFLDWCRGAYVEDYRVLILLRGRIL